MSRQEEAELFAREVAWAVRGPESLRQDIEDEIADHLVCDMECHSEGGKCGGEEVGEAINRFGETAAVVKEFRAVHLGGRIMFQRITIAALIVLVCGLGLTAYFSWRESRVTRNELEKVQEQLAAMNASQAATAPPVIRVRCFSGPPEVPVEGLKVRIDCVDEAYMEPRGSRISTKYSEEFATGKDGMVIAEGLVPGHYRVHAGGWMQRVEAFEYGKTVDLEFNVKPRYEHTIRVEVPEELTWDRERMKTAVVLFGTGREKDFQWWSEKHEIDLFEGTNVTGLIPGKKLTAKLQLASSDNKGWLKVDFGRPFATIQNVVCGGDGEDVLLPLAGEFIEGFVFDGSRDNPVVGQKLDLVCQAWGYNARQKLVTDESGRFCWFRCRGPKSKLWGFENKAFDEGSGIIELPWECGNGDRALFTWPAGESSIVFGVDGAKGGVVEVDVSKFVPVRLNVTGLDRLADRGMQVVREPQVSWSLIRERDDKLTPLRGSVSWRVELDILDDNVDCMMLWPGKLKARLLLDADPVEPGEVSRWDFMSPVVTVDGKSGESVEVSFAVDDEDQWIARRDRASGR